MKDWWIYKGVGTPQDRLAALARKQPPWRRFDGRPDPAYEPPGATGRAWERTERRGADYVADESEIDAVNTALYLRRPLLVTGKPGVGKSTLAYHIAVDLGLGPVLHWPITSRSTLRDGLYRYDAISRLHDANLQRLQADRESRDVLAPAPTPAPAAEGGARALNEPVESEAIAPYLRLGPLGTALLPQQRPRVLLVDEIDKSDIDLPGDLLTVFEDGGFEIPELARIAARQPRLRLGTDDEGATSGALVERGRVQCHAFPIIVLTSNNERDFPPPFLRRCIRLNVEPPSVERLAQIVRQRLRLPDWLSPEHEAVVNDLISTFDERRADGDLATDQLLNAVQLRLSGAWSDDSEREAFLDTVLQRLTGPGAP